MICLSLSIIYGVDCLIIIHDFIVFQDKEISGIIQIRNSITSCIMK